MNREWRRAPTDCLCGYCSPNRTIKKGEAALYISLPFVKKQRVRCQSCAEGTPPDDLPELLVSGGIEPTTPVRAKREERQTMREWMPYREAGEEG